VVEHILGSNRSNVRPLLLLKRKKAIIPCCCCCCCEKEKAIKRQSFSSTSNMAAMASG